MINPVPAEANLRIMFAVFQTENLANGGVNSITEIITGISGYRHVLTQMETPTNTKWRSSGAEVTVLDVPYQPGASFAKQSLWSKMLWVRSLIANNLKLVRLLRSEKIDVLHCNDPAPFWHVVPAARWCGVPVVFNLRDTKSGTERRTPSRYRRKFRHVSMVLVLSREMASFYQRLVGADWLKSNRIGFDFIYSIVDPPEKGGNAANALGSYEQTAASDTIKLGIIAAFNDKKNQLDFIKYACPSLVSRSPNIQIYFVGDFRPDQDSYAETCRCAAEASGLRQNIFFTGYDSDIWRWYKYLDIVVIASRKEGLARCMIESLAAATPVVSFDVCSAREVLEDHECGIVVRQGDYEAMVNAINRLSGDGELRLRMSKAGETTARKLFSKSGILADYRKLYEQFAD